MLVLLPTQQTDAPLLHRGLLRLVRALASSETHVLEEGRRQELEIPPFTMWEKDSDMSTLSLQLPWLSQHGGVDVEVPGHPLTSVAQAYLQKACEDLTSSYGSLHPPRQEKMPVSMSTESGFGGIQVRF